LPAMQATRSIWAPPGSYAVGIGIAVGVDVAGAGTGSGNPIGRGQPASRFGKGCISRRQLVKCAPLYVTPVGHVLSAN
jgi:hypothetical protein